MATSIEAQIQALTREFIEDLAQLVRQSTLEAVLTGLQGKAVRERPARGAPSGVIQPTARRMHPTAIPTPPPPATVRDDRVELLESML